MLAGTADAQTKVAFTCGSFTAEMWRTASTSHWTITQGKESNTETAVLKKGPRFVCVGAGTLAIEFVAASGQSFLDLHFPDGTTIGYGGQHLERNNRFILPIQARPRIPEAYRAAFDYHCRLEMPADPIPANVRKDCVL